MAKKTKKFAKLRKNKLISKVPFNNKLTILLVVGFVAIGAFLIYRTFANSIPGNVVFGKFTPATSTTANTPKGSAQVSLAQAAPYELLSDGTVMCNDGTNPSLLKTTTLSSSQLGDILNQVKQTGILTQTDGLNLADGQVLIDNNITTYVYQDSGQQKVVIVPANQPVNTVLQKLDAIGASLCQKAGKTIKGKSAPIPGGPKPQDKTLKQPANLNTLSERIKNYLSPQTAEAASTTMRFSTTGPISGMNCTPIVEPADPNWKTAYFCTGTALNLKWSNSGPISGMNCTSWNEPSDPAKYTWGDNYLCVLPGFGINFQFSNAGPIAGKSCVSVNNPSEPSAYTWGDNYVCQGAGNYPTGFNANASNELWTKFSVTRYFSGEGIPSRWGCLDWTASIWSAKMASVGYIYHSMNQTIGAPLLDYWGCTGWTYVGENVGVVGCQTSPTIQACADIIWNAWMASPEHRANIVMPYWSRSGMGTYVDSSGRLYATQHFWL